jgi:hypothetical protein
MDEVRTVRFVEEVLYLISLAEGAAAMRLVLPSDQLLGWKRASTCASRRWLFFNVLAFD